MMSLERFIELRGAERDWAQVNGFNNWDPETNGAMALIAACTPSFDWFFDIGAGRGTYAARVTSIQPDAQLSVFEPNGVLIPALRSQFPRGDVRAAALSDRSGEMDLFVPEKHRQSASLHRRTHIFDAQDNRVRTVRTSVRTLDSFDFPIKDRSIFLRAGVNGHEARVLRGAAKTLSSSAKTGILFSHSSAWLEIEESLLGILVWLNENGFGLYRVLPYGLERLSAYVTDMERAHFCHYAAFRNFGIDEAAGWMDIATPSGQSGLLTFDAILNAAKLAPMRSGG